MHKKIIIVGASSGIGKKMAELYVEKGHRVGITARRKELLDEIQQQSPQQVEYESFDVMGTENIKRLEDLVSKLGGMDLLVISAGMGEPDKELKWEIDRQTIHTNVNGFVEIANWGFNYFLKQGYGQLGAISSIASKRGSSWAPAYNASKAFQSSYLEGLAIKACKMNSNIYITCAEPGFVATKMAKTDRPFWVVPVKKAARQIMTAIDRKKRRVYISRRWALIGKLLKWLPYWIYKKIG